MSDIKVNSNNVYMGDILVAIMRPSIHGWLALWTEDDLSDCMGVPTREDAIAFILAEMWD